VIKAEKRKKRDARKKFTENTDEKKEAGGRFHENLAYLTLG